MKIDSFLVQFLVTKCLFRKNINSVFSNKISVNPQLPDFPPPLGLAELIGGNSSGAYLRENQVLQFFFETTIFVLD